MSNLRCLVCGNQIVSVHTNCRICHFNHQQDSLSESDLLRNKIKFISILRKAYIGPERLTSLDEIESAINRKLDELSVTELVN